MGVSTVFYLNFNLDGFSESEKQRTRTGSDVLKQMRHGDKIASRRFMRRTQTAPPSKKEEEASQGSVTDIKIYNNSFYPLRKGDKL